MQLLEGEVKAPMIDNHCGSYACTEFKVLTIAHWIVVVHVRCLCAKSSRCWVLLNNVLLCMVMSDEHHGHHCYALIIVSFHYFLSFARLLPLNWFHFHDTLCCMLALKLQAWNFTYLNSLKIWYILDSSWLKVMFLIQALFKLCSLVNETMHHMFAWGF
jgi:hypothetical protein